MGRASIELAKLTEKLSAGRMDPDEPIFILRGRDRCSAEAVRFWASLAEEQGSPAPKVQEARELAGDMDDWPVQQVPGRPDTLADLRGLTGGYTP